MALKKSSTQLAVIGAGPGGYAAAFLAADLGMDVALIDLELNPGGVCLYRGCIPSKALLHVAKVIGDSRAAAQWGVSFSNPKIDLDRLRHWKEDVVAKLTGGLGRLSDQRKIRYIQGRAKFADANTLRIEGANGEEEDLSFERAILAAGSRPAALQNPPLDLPRMMDSAAALSLQDVPERLLVVGGGYIGLELGTVYAAFGSKVTVVEMTPHLLPGVDRDLVRPLAKRLENEFEAIFLETKAAKIRETGGGLAVTFEGKIVEAHEREFDKILVSVGRRPNSEGLGLENTKVAVNESGYVEADAQLRTAEPSIYAIGDLIGQPMLAHKASHQGRTAVEAIAGRNVTFEPAAIPSVVFTNPEIAWCGLTETNASEEKRKVRIARFPWSASGRALAIGAGEGLTKIIVDPETERILGMGICGSGAGDLIAEGVLAVEMGACVEDLKLTIHPHPTLSETIMEAAEVFSGQSSHFYRPRRK